MWEQRCGELREYREEHGDCNVPQRQGHLGVWVGRQRQYYKKGTLSDERIAGLESIGLVWDLNEREWLDRFDELAGYRAKNGDCNVPESQGPLGKWVSQQRRCYKKGKSSQERLDLLESIGFSWEPIDETWMSRFDELVRFKDETGHCNVPYNQGQLGMWVSRQRFYYKQERLQRERVELLESIGFAWVRQTRTRTQPWKLDEQWKTRYTELVQYLIQHGTCNVPRKYGPLGRWANNQRRHYREGSISQFRIDYLESIGFSWKPKRAGIGSCSDQYSKPDPGAIARIIEDEKPRHEDLPSGATEALETRVDVGRRLAEVLQEYLGNESVRLMQTYEGPRKIDVKWQTRYTELVRHLIEHGNCDVPQKQGALRTWICTQRRSYREGCMSQLRREYLESIGFVWTTKRKGSHWLPDRYSRPDPEAIARIIEDEKPRHEKLPSSAPESLRERVKADRDLVGALQKYLAKLEKNQ